MIDLDREYKALRNHMNRYKRKRLGFECGCACGYVADVRMVERTGDIPRHIEVIGQAGFDAKDRVILAIFDHMKKGRDYKYLKEYHILERYR